MEILWISLICLGALLLIAFIFTLVCFFMVFYQKKRRPLKEDEFLFPNDKTYLPFKDYLHQSMRASRKLPHEDVSIKSQDGLKLVGKLYEYKKGAPTEIMFHGYRGSGERDMCIGIERAFKVGHNALVVDQRAGGMSDGNVITFGIKECKDCLKWVDFLIKKLGDDSKIILTGISMGAATVLMAGGHDLPKNVIGVLADCGYSSPKEIICKVIKDMHLPVKLAYPFVKLSAKLFGRFDLEEYSPIEAVKNCKVPVVFIHGEADDFVPCEMSVLMYRECASKKRLVTVKNAEHALSYLVDGDTYISALRDFYDE